MRKPHQGTIVAVGIAALVVAGATAQAQRFDRLTSGRGARPRAAAAANGTFQLKSSPEEVTPVNRGRSGMPIAMAMVIDPGGPVFPVEVDPGLVLQPGPAAQFQQMAGTLSGYAGVPQDRLDYYSWLIASNDYTIDGWQGIVQGVVQQATGYDVFVKVIPSMATPAAIAADYTEHYFVANDSTIQYQGAADPQGLAGLPPPEIDEY